MRTIATILIEDELGCRCETQIPSRAARWLACRLCGLSISAGYSAEPAKNGNWALAAYMSKYMNGAMNPARVTKPDEYKSWKSFYETTFAPVNKAIEAKDFKQFESAYSGAIANCNGYHAGMGYAFIKIVKLSAPADGGIDYRIKSNPGDVPP